MFIANLRFSFYLECILKPRNKYVLDESGSTFYKRAMDEIERQIKELKILSQQKQTATQTQSTPQQHTHMTSQGQTPAPLPPIYQKKLALQKKHRSSCLIPISCGAGCLVLIAFVVMILVIVFGFMKSSDVYKTALDRAQHSTGVIEVLGEPIESGWFVSGSINTSGSTGNASLEIPITGPNGAGTIHVQAQKSQGKWQFSSLVVEIKDKGLTINLNAGQ